MSTESKVTLILKDGKTIEVTAEKGIMDHSHKKGTFNGRYAENGLVRVVDVTDAKSPKELYKFDSDVKRGNVVFHDVSRAFVSEGEEDD